MDGKETQLSETTENSLIPTNIRHKYGTSLVDQLISTDQVKRTLNESEKSTSHSLGYQIPRPILKPWLAEKNPHRVYYELGQCLRTNIFPGVPVQSQSLVQDSYTAEVKEKVNQYTTCHWFGKKTDDLAIWSQMITERTAINKKLERLLKPLTAFPARPTVQKEIPVTAPPSKTDKNMCITKSKKKKIQSQIQPAPTLNLSEDDDFWDFYEKPI
ncbi:testis-expressed protein 33 [Spea bombifrons]|uniref:testis-expressed protein 33 n=1 Tax=Spea bombifrons TaxID=233779 RepID=UPI0023490AD0|nr:testis-expressed protein 33 [Spea bombifrons]